MIIIMQRTLEYLTNLSKDKNMSKEQAEMLANIWEGVGPSNVRETEDGIKYVIKD
jgi:(p)ppGpp synthase/HD superfamily hydrolase